MLEVEKITGQEVDYNTIKLIIKASKDVLVPSKLEPKELKSSTQMLELGENQNIEPLFEIY